MNTKKNYIQPASKVVKIETDIIAGSNDELDNNTVNLLLDPDGMQEEVGFAD